MLQPELPLNVSRRWDKHHLPQQVVVPAVVLVPDLELDRTVGQNQNHISNKQNQVLIQKSVSNHL